LWLEPVILQLEVEKNYRPEFETQNPNPTFQTLKTLKLKPTTQTLKIPVSHHSNTKHDDNKQQSTTKHKAEAATMKMLAIWTRVRSSPACNGRNMPRLESLVALSQEAPGRRSDSLPIFSFSSFGIHTGSNNDAPCAISSSDNNNLSTSTSLLIRLSKLISQNSPTLTMSRREAERMIKSGKVTIAGETIIHPQLLVDFDQVRFGALCVNGKAVQVVAPNSNSNNNNEEKGKQQHQYQHETDETKKTRVWLVHKLSGELVADSDEHDRPCLMQRLKHGGVGRTNKGRHLHLKSIGRLDMTTEGLILVTNDGAYSREMELPSNHVHRTYRVRVHGLLTSHKSKRIQNGVTIDGIHYKGMRLEQVERTSKNKNNRQVGVDSSSRRTSGGTNKWLTITCTEGKNRQIRKVFEYLGLNVTRLIRISYGDYHLQTIPAGMAIEVPVKPVGQQRRRGKLITNTTATTERRKLSKISNATAHDDVSNDTATSPVQWVRHV
jgi:23S rRNA pseudouridine2605 synthase